MNHECSRVPSLLPPQPTGGGANPFWRQRCFFVADNGKLLGMLTLRDITAIPQQKWRFTTTGQAMVPISRVVHVTPQMDLMVALQTMDNANVASCPSWKARIWWYALPEEIVRYLRTRLN